jgi:hypothetical protein
MVSCKTAVGQASFMLVDATPDGGWVRNAYNGLCKAAHPVKLTHFTGIDGSHNTR